MNTRIEIAQSLVDLLRYGRTGSGTTHYVREAIGILTSDHADEFAYSEAQHHIAQALMTTNRPSNVNHLLQVYTALERVCVTV